MELSELVKIRRSVRSYSEERISESKIRQIIACAQLSPSWKNTQTGRYYVALSDEAIETVMNCLPDFNQNSSKNAAYIISSYQKGLSGAGSDEGDLWGAYDLGLQNAYLLLKASELGYDTLIMGLRDVQGLKEYFGIPDDETVLPVIAIGKRKGEPVFKPRKDPDEILKIR